MDKNNKGLMTAFKTWLSSFDSKEVAFAMVTLDDKVTQIEAEAFEAGNAVSIVVEDGDNVPMPVGEFKLEDGQILVVKEEGVIDSIGEATEEEPKEEEPTEEPKEEEEVAQTKGTSPVARKIVEAVTKETHFSVEVMNAITANVEIMLSEQEVEVVAEEVVVDSIVAEDANVEEVAVEEVALSGLVDSPKHEEIAFSGNLSLMDILNK
tara:strand:+ start:556 stop:1179 length:624 start_codon:yes stop_codon:yes gene_type:complete